MSTIRIALAGVALALAAAPAFAGPDGGQNTPTSSTPVPELADFALFGAGVAGVLFGRWSSRRRRSEPPSDD